MEAPDTAAIPAVIGSLGIGNCLSISCRQRLLVLFRHAYASFGFLHRPALLSGTQITVAHRESLLPPVFRSLLVSELASTCLWCRPIARRPAGPGESPSSATSTFSRPSPSPWSAPSTCKCGLALARRFYLHPLVVSAPKDSSLLARPSAPSPSSSSATG